MHTKWFINHNTYPFCTSLINKQMPLTSPSLSPKYFIPYLPSDCRKLLAYKINSHQLIYVSYNQNISKTSRYHHESDNFVFPSPKPFNLEYATDPLQYETLYQYDIQIKDKSAFQHSLTNYTDLIAYTPKPNRKHIYTLIRLTPNNHPVSVEYLIADEDWNHHTFT